jgi:YD repeat-containing protein
LRQATGFRWSHRRYLIPKVSLSRLVLQVVHGQHNHGEPLLGGFKALRVEIAQSQSFGYDPLDRLVSASAMGGSAGQGQYTESYTYNAIGNLMSKGGVTYTYPASGPTSVRPHAVTGTSNGGAFSYNANGNMTSRRDKTGDPTYTQTWDYDNRLISVTGNGQTTTYTYDGNGALLKKVVGSTTTIYVGNYYEKTGSVIRKYYYFAGQRVAMRDGSTVYYLVTDHPSASLRTVLGSTSKTLTSSGGVFAELRYCEASRSGVDKPYGEIRYTSGTTPTNYRFTGQLQEAGVGLYNMGARW